MGIATIMVALFHSSIVRANDGIDLFFFVGDMGVDVFFFVSGLGMFFAWSKKPALKQFYINRFLRIVPTWFLVNLIVQFETIISGQIDWWKEIKCFTGLSFILDGNLYFWYVPAILLLYLLTPVIMKQYEKETFSFETYSFDALEFIICRYYGYLPRVKREQPEQKDVKLD